MSARYFLRSWRYTIQLGILLAFVLTVLVILGVQDHECRDHGGKFVRSLTWYTCIQEKP